jgi:hypothetical protein
MSYLAPIDLTGEPTVWAYQDLQAFDHARRAWLRQNVLPVVGPSGVWRAKLSDLTLWNPYAAWPIHMGENRDGYRARLMVWDEGRWKEKRVVHTGL